MLLRYCIRYVSFVCVLALLGCSSGGATATCSSSRSCPDGLRCNVERGLCMQPPELDLAGSSVDLAMPMRDLSMPPPPGSRVCPDPVTSLCITSVELVVISNFHSLRRVHARR